jgi:hypothetical protein
MRWGGVLARVGEMKNSHKILVGKLEGKKPLGRTGRKWEDNIRLDFWESRTGCIRVRIQTSGELL